MKWRWRIGLIGGLTLLCGGLFVLGHDFYRLFYQPMNFDSTRAVVVRVDKATTAAAFAHKLYTQHLIKSDRLFLNFIRAQGLSQRLKAGVYQVTPHESAQQFLYRVVAGDVLTSSFSIIEGTTQKQIAARLAQAAFLNYHANDWDILNKNCHIQGKEVDGVEGLLLADTYQYVAGSSSYDLLFFSI